MSLAERLAQLDSELDALTNDLASQERVCAQVLNDRSSDLHAVDRELGALAADVAGLDSVLDAARQQAASRSAEMASLAAERTEQARAARAEVEARVAAMTAEQGAARAARAERAQREAHEREAAAAARAQREAAALEAATAERAQREAAALAAARAAATDASAAVTAGDDAERQAGPQQTPHESAADTLGQLLADELDESPAATEAPSGAADNTDIFGADLFGDLGADAFDAPQEALADVVTSDAPSMSAPSMLADLASILELEEARGSAPRSESAALMSELLDAATETEVAAQEAQEAQLASSPEPRQKTVPPPVPSDSVRPPAFDAAALEGARESFEDLSDELDVIEVDDFEIIIDESDEDEREGDAGGGTGTELDGPGLSVAELEQALQTSADQPPRSPDEPLVDGDEEGEPEEKKGFFKKLFG